MTTAPGLKECLFDGKTQQSIILRLINYSSAKGIVQAEPLYGTIQATVAAFNEKGHQTSQNFLKDRTPSPVDTLRFDLLAEDMQVPLQSGDAVFLTWIVKRPPHRTRGQADPDVGTVDPLRVIHHQGRSHCQHAPNSGRSVL